MKKINLLVVSAAIVVLVGCSMKGEQPDSKANINNVKFQLPQNIQWVSNKSKDGSSITFLPKGTTIQNSKVKVIYQFIKHDNDPKVLAEKMLAPLRANCEKSVVNVSKTASKYPNQMSLQTICNKLKNGSVGVVRNLSLYTDVKGSYALISEVLTPVSKEPGQFPAPKTVEEKQQMQGMVNLINTIQKTMIETAVCDVKGKCV